MRIARAPLGLLALFALLLPAASMVPVGAAEFEPKVPCKDEPLCPDLIVDPVRMAATQVIETKNFSATSCDVQEGHVPSAGTHKLLRWTFNTPNIGAGDLYVGRPSQHPEWFTFHPCHNHHHFREYADYRLWTQDGYRAYVQVRAASPTLTFEDLLAANPQLASGFVGGQKQGFCVIDLTTIGGLPLIGPYSNCNDQGISVGWADEYHRSLRGQWIVIDGVPSGTYILENEVNAERLYKESSYANNAWAVPARIP